MFKLNLRQYALAAVFSLAMSPAWAYHMVWLDFSDFDLDSWSSVNGSPVSSADESAVERQILANVIKDYASVDIVFSKFQPRNGRYTRVFVLGTDAGGLYGCAGPSCCVGPDANCTGIGSWDDNAISAAEVYSGSFSDFSSLTGANATTTRIANAISHTLSHELGHVLGLSHCHAADDAFEVGCGNATSSTADTNPTWHVMASGSSWGLNRTQRATRDRFFSVHASRRILNGSFQIRNHYQTMGNLNAGANWSDLLYGRIESPSVMRWYGRRSTGSAFGGYKTYRNDAGEAGNLYFLEDVNGDRRADLIYGVFRSRDTVRWYVRYGTSANNFGGARIFVNDAGAVGDIYRVADVTGDGRADLVYGRPRASNRVTWYVRPSTGTSFGSASIWSNDSGDEGDLFFLADIDADDDADMVYARIISDSTVRWYVRRSNGSRFGNFSVWAADAGDRNDLFYVGDTGGDGDADLNYARLFSKTQLTWYYRPSEVIPNGQSRFGNFTVWSNDAGDAGDIPRLGDGNGDGKLDLFYARHTGLTTLTGTPSGATTRWFGRLSQGGSFGNYTTWRSDAGDDGDIVP